MHISTSKTPFNPNKTLSSTTKSASLSFIPLSFCANDVNTYHEIRLLLLSFPCATIKFIFLIHPLNRTLIGDRCARTKHTFFTVTTLNFATNNVTSLLYAPIPNYFFILLFHYSTTTKTHSLPPQPPFPCTITHAFLCPLSEIHNFRGSQGGLKTILGSSLQVRRLRAQKNKKIKRFRVWFGCALRGQTRVKYKIMVSVEPLSKEKEKPNRFART